MSHKKRRGSISSDKMRVPNYRGKSPSRSDNCSVDSMVGRVGMPLRPDLPQKGDEVGFAGLVTAGLERGPSGGNSGGNSGFGRWLTDQGHDEEVVAESTQLPGGAVEIAEQDLYDQGTPGQGVELVDGEEYGSVESTTAHRLIARRTLLQLERDLSVLKSQFSELLHQAQSFENKGDQVRASLCDNRVLDLKVRIDRLEKVTIPTRRRYEKSATEDDYSSGMRFE